MAVEAPLPETQSAGGGSKPTPQSISDEQILVVPTEVFHRLGHFQGFSPDAEVYLAELLKPEHVSFRPRGEMEQDPSFKQLIPYCILRYTSEEGVESLFEYTRGTGQGEGRLHRKRSIGIGGHISALDAAGSNGDPYRTGMRRELDEEIIIDTPFCEHCVGLINDDESEVGRVHLGIVHIFDLGRPAIQPREDDIIACGFRSVAELQGDLTGFETWSSICLAALFGGA